MVDYRNDLRPLAIGPKNAEAVIGHSWRWARDTARRLGVTVHRMGAKPWIDPDEFMAAIRKQGAALGVDTADRDASAEPAEDELTAMRRRIARAG